MLDHAVEDAADALDAATRGGARHADQATVIEQALGAVQALRELALEQARQLAKTYADRREELRLSMGTGFIGIELYVRARNDNRSVGLEWQKGHFKNGVRTGASSITGKKRGSASYDLAKLKAETPEWAIELVTETEREARLIREALMRLTDADTNLQVAAQRLARPDAPSDTDPADPFADMFGSEPAHPTEDAAR